MDSSRHSGLSIFHSKHLLRKELVNLDALKRHIHRWVTGTSLPNRITLKKCRVFINSGLSFARLPLFSVKSGVESCEYLDSVINFDIFA